MGFAALRPRRPFRVLRGMVLNATDDEIAHHSLKTPVCKLEVLLVPHTLALFATPYPNKKPDRDESCRSLQAQDKQSATLLTSAIS